MGNMSYGIDPEMLTVYAEQIKQLLELKVEVAVVIGGGNIFVAFRQKRAVLNVFRGIIWVCLPPL